MNGLLSARIQVEFSISADKAVITRIEFQVDKTEMERSDFSNYSFRFKVYLNCIYQAKKVLPLPIELSVCSWGMMF